MKLYRVNDINDGLFGPDYKIEAASPKDAAAALGYSNIKRDISGKIGNLVIYGPRGSYVYSGYKEA